MTQIFSAGKLPGESRTKISSETIAMEVGSEFTDGVGGEQMATVGGGSFKLPRGLPLQAKGQSVSLQVVLSV